MKEFKASKKNEVVENDILFTNDDLIDKKINEDLKEIKEKLNAEKLSDEFKANLNAKLQEELNKTEDSSKSKIIKFPNITRKLAGICACFVFLFSSCLVFADDIENVILELFGNTDKIIANAIEDGNYKEIDMDYVEDQGISIKVDYVVVEDDELYIAFNVLGDEYYKFFLKNINIKTKNDVILYTNNKNEENSKFIADTNYVYDNNMVIIYKLTESKFDFMEMKNLNVEISEINYVKDNIFESKNGKWNLEINI